MVALLLFVASDGRWTLAAVWHASLNATGGLFFHRMVTGADHDRIAHLMAAGYALVALVAYLASGAGTCPAERPASAGAAASGTAVISAAPRRVHHRRKP